MQSVLESRLFNARSAGRNRMEDKIQGSLTYKRRRKAAPKIRLTAYRNDLTQFQDYVLGHVVDFRSRWLG